jgi:23S rRNA-/tRNA-specific pseudouridylate synthase
MLLRVACRYAGKSIRTTIVASSRRRWYSNTRLDEPRVVLEDPAFLVVEKPSGMHTAPLAPKDATELPQAQKLADKSSREVRRWHSFFQLHPPYFAI